MSKEAERKRPVRTASVTTVKITRHTRDFIMGKARWGETVDETLKRLLSIPNGEGRR